ncbi:MAG: hypothetical protein WC851_04300 [Candidatus Shapirobacteria bacterium]|jgi:hypothetical protein
MAEMIKSFVSRPEGVVIPEQINPQSILGEIENQFTLTLDALSSSPTPSEEVRLDHRLDHLYAAEQIVTKLIEEPGTKEVSNLKKLFVGHLLANCILPFEVPESQTILQSNEFQARVVQHQQLRYQIAGALGYIAPVAES